MVLFQFINVGKKGNVGKGKIAISPEERFCPGQPIIPLSAGALLGF